MKRIAVVILTIAVVVACTIQAHAQTDSASLRAATAHTSTGSAPKPADDPTPQYSAEAYAAMSRTLLMLFTLAVILESALAIIFGWRPFLEFFNARTVKPLVAFLVALGFVSIFHLDLVSALIRDVIKGSTVKSNALGYILTALVLAGGSAAVKNLLVTLGFRKRTAPEEEVPKPPADKAWLAVRLKRSKARGPVHVFLGSPAANGGALPLVGVIHGESTPGASFLLSDPGRFPGYGGHAVVANSSIAVELVGRDANGERVATPTWGPYTVAGAALIDLDFTL